MLFIDAQNAYQSARRAFAGGSGIHVVGQFYPDLVGRLLADRGLAGATGDRVLKEVRVYTGRPDATKDPKGNGAHMKQCATWAARGVTVIARPLRYPRDWPAEKAQEKGIDVALATDFVAMAIDDEYDVGIVFSSDTDLLPALELARRQPRPGKIVEVAAWRSEGHVSQIRIPGVWCHRLGASDYAQVTDNTDYRP